ncbi:uncharacterized protein LOC106664012 [Cimex lectularius]|uniref:Transmembrane inner ear expressed protein n=1 Tax=Cimex lectularius TaxID=79782 RepID=A0A8I6RGD1_CIMLE|nr:uncharacterized protein LOC106664012 [Cimex lectularius]
MENVSKRNTTEEPMETILLIGNEEWLEETSLWNLRLWHVILIFFSGFLSIVICLCCCIRFRIPRTKQEIEADYIRKKITRKFKKRLTMIHNTEMDEMDLKKALDRIRAEFKSDTESVAHSEYSVGSVDSNGQPISRAGASRKVSDIGVDIEQLIEQRTMGSKFARLMGSFRKIKVTKKPQNGDEVVEGETKFA